MEPTPVVHCVEQPSGARGGAIAVYCFEPCSPARLSGVRGAVSFSVEQALIVKSRRASLALGSLNRTRSRRCDLKTEARRVGLLASRHLAIVPRIADSAAGGTRLACVTRAPTRMSWHDPPPQLHARLRPRAPVVHGARPRRTPATPARGSPARSQSPERGPERLRGSIACVARSLRTGCHRRTRAPRRSRRKTSACWTRWQSRDDGAMRPYDPQAQLCKRTETRIHHCSLRWTSS